MEITLSLFPKRGEELNDYENRYSKEDGKLLVRKLLMLKGFSKGSQRVNSPEYRSFERECISAFFFLVRTTKRKTKKGPPEDPCG